MKICMAPLNPFIGDIEANTQKIILTIKNNLQADLIVFPELAITGYPPRDLIEREDFIEKQLKGFEEIRNFTKDIQPAVILGYIGKNTGKGRGFYNSLAVLQQGKKYQYNKRLLPTYNIFDESRYFEPGDSIGVTRIKGKKVGLLICEDAWNDKGIKELYSVNPVDDLQKEGVDLIVSINASPHNIGKQRERMEIFPGICKRLHSPLIYVNQFGGNDDLVFDGSSFTLNKEGRRIEDTVLSESPLCIDIDKGYGGMDPFTHSDKMFEIYTTIMTGLKDYLKKCGFQKVIIGSSGGIDSAVVMALAVDTLGKDNVEAITMPSKFSSTGSWEDSELLCKNLGIKLYTRGIKEEYDLVVENFKKSFGLDPSPLTKENIQARIRGRILMEYSNHFGSLVLSTGNKSEMAVGYCSIYGDMCGGLAPISDLYKMEVYGLAKYLNRMYELGGSGGIPLSIIDKEPSAELSEDQRDTDSLPPYPVLDAILKIFLEGDLLNPEELKELKGVAKDGDSDKIRRMVDRAEYKRRQAPPTIRVHKRAWGLGRQIPIAHGGS